MKTQLVKVFKKSISNERFSVTVKEASFADTVLLISKDEKKWSYEFVVAVNGSFEIRKFKPFAGKSSRVKVGVGQAELIEAVALIK